MPEKEVQRVRRMKEAAQRTRRRELIAMVMNAGGDGVLIRGWRSEVIDAMRSVRRVRREDVRS